ncbi:N-acetylmuramoyl-L-alanine amidase [Deinococcus sp. KNUC1210]|uniref:N-acetylmuramoyl-L-alanine amidase family protein n=1 Tax=Deinococcus sp. KNUC1210 TaxID=2917691 RepID=UPI001EEFA40A|nr:N-acetylmuramoyl-L-alanine amidase [Deinococcus sp. KNUC1210]ULH15939.1 N-acetylmuramoyl-L-alanine amidase [Deinococcus sp. KNUC1210]
MNGSSLILRRSVRFWGRAGLISLVAWAGLAGAQYAFSALNLAGRTAQSVTLYGAEYAGQSTLSRLLSVSEAGGVAYVVGLGHTLLLPIDEDNQRATTDFNTVQLDAERVKARTATRLDGKLLLPLDTLARGLGASYTPGNFTVPAVQLSGVSSLAGAKSDRVVFDLTRNVTVREELIGGSLRLTLVGAAAQTRNYTTRGAFMPRVQVTAGAGGAAVTVPLPAHSGYQLFTVQRPSGARVVLDLGPGLPLNVPALVAELRKPLIVLDPAGQPGTGQDVTLEVARNAAELLSRAGWQVRLTRDTAHSPDVTLRQDLARQSDVFVSLDLGRFPNAARKGVTVYEAAGQAPSQIISAYRQAQGAPLVSAAVSDAAESRRLSDLLRGELKTGGLSAQQEPQSRLLLLGEAPHAALLLELGWPQNSADQQRLSNAAQNTQMAQALARAVATYLTARANGGPS